MSKNGIESALQSIEYQKKVQQLKFNETKKGRKGVNEGQLSIAADRGLIRMHSKTNSLGYNSKMKILNDRLSSQIMDKYKTKFSYMNSNKRPKDFINKDTVKMVRAFSDPSGGGPELKSKGSSPMKAPILSKISSLPTSREQKLNMKYQKKMTLVNSDARDVIFEEEGIQRRASQPSMDYFTHPVSTPRYNLNFS